MPTVEIDHALSGSQIPQNNFTATGTWADNNTPNAITCVLRPGDIAPTNPTQVNGNGTWTATFNGLTSGNAYTLHAEFSTASDDEPNLRVSSNNDPTLTIDPLTPPPGLPPAGPPRGTGGGGPDANLVNYTVSGTYNKRNVGVFGVCMAVTRNGNSKKIQSVEALAPIPMPNMQGNWSVTLSVSPVGQGQKLSIIAIMIDEDGVPTARAGRKSPKRP